MNEKSYRVLEYYKIKELLKKEAASVLTKAFIDELMPSVNPYEIKERMDKTNEAATVILHKGALALGNFYDLKDHISLAQKGGSLTFKELLEVLYNLKGANYAKEYLKSDIPSLPYIDELSFLLNPLSFLTEEIDRSILSEDEMSDNASPDLRNLRRKITQKNDAIRNKMNSILNSADNRNLLQDALVTIRQGRYVIPVKQEHKGRLPGIVHDQSSTGATLFIEPQAIVNLNNELRELELEEKKEVARIVAQLSSMVGESGDIIGNNQHILVELDFMFAKARLSAKMQGQAPEIKENGSLKILSGRHPLLDEETAVPISVALGENYDTLIITGPNTGGKTVSLKTIGLFVLMAQSGLHLPAEKGTSMPIYRKVYADIGDEQSIEQSLSTFSSHMTNIVNIVKESEEDTLVLLDELGAGTDPTEGAALGIAILDELRSKGASVVATTHYAELKKYALATEGIQNASMEFDIESLSPTFKLTIGTPGRSNAFEISKKLGLPEHIIERSKQLIAKEDLAFEDVLESIEKDRKLAEEDRDEALLLRLRLKRQQEELDKEKDKILDRAKKEAKKIIEETKDYAKEVQDELRELQKQGKYKGRPKISGITRDLTNLSSKYGQEAKEPVDTRPASFEELKIGDRVFIPSLGQKGEILNLDEEKKEGQVQIGLMKVSLAEDQIAIMLGGGARSKSKKKKESSKFKYGNLYGNKVANISSSINVVGKNLDDARMDVDKYLDDAFMAGLKEVNIIHGRGAGILREGLANMFKNHKHVESFRKGHYNEGGDGVSVVKLK